MRRFWAVAFSFTTLWASRGFADGPPRLTTPGDVTLTWTTPSGCPSTQSVLAQIERTVTTAKFGYAEIDADVREVGPHRWSVRLVTNVDAAHGERTIEADSCAALADATALVVALAIDSVHEAAGEVSPTPIASPTKRTDISDEAAAPSAAPDATLSGLVALTLLGDFGMLPHFGAAPGLTIGLKYGPLRAEISGDVWFAQDTTNDVTNQGAHLQLVDGAARACWQATFGALDIAPCLGAGLAYLSLDAIGGGSSNSNQTSAAWAMARVDLIATFMIAKPIAIRALVGAAIPLERDAIDLDDEGGGVHELYRPAAISRQMAIGVEAHFP